MTPGLERFLWEATGISLDRMASDRIRGFTRRAILVRPPEQVHRSSLNREAEREESGRKIEGLSAKTFYLPAYVGPTVIKNNIATFLS